MRKIEKNFYLYEHQDKHGQWSHKYYAVFNDHKGIERRIPLSPKKTKAKNMLGGLLDKRDSDYDFDTPKRERIEAQKQKLRGITFEQFGKNYFEGKISAPLVNGRPKRESTLGWEKMMFNNLVPYFGEMPLPEIKKNVIDDFAAKRVKDSVDNRRQKDDTSPRRLGNEPKFLRYLLNRALDSGYLDAVPKIKISKPAHRRGYITEENYVAMLEGMGRDPMRYLIGLWETGWRLNEPRKLLWNKKNRDGKLLVDLKAKVLRLDRDDVKEDYPRSTPISPALMKVLMELRPADSIKVEPVFIRFVHGKRKPIKSIREAFNAARVKADIPHAILHDIRRSTIRRWEMMGISRQAVMQATGHRPNTVHEQYAELSEEQLLQAFAPLFAEPKSKVSAKAV